MKARRNKTRKARRNKPMKGRFTLLLAFGLVALVVVKSLPDITRYLKMREM